MTFPLVHEISYQDPCQLFSHFQAEEGSLFLDSAEQRAHSGRYSFIALDPFLVLSGKNGVVTKNGQVFRANPFEALKEELQRFSLKTLPNLPPFQGGAAGYFAYDLAQHLEPIALASVDELQFPDLLLGFYDVVLAFDQLERRAWVFSSGFPVNAEEEREKRAQERLQTILSRLQGLTASSPPQSVGSEPLKVETNFSAQEYEQLVQKTIHYILAGDIFEANLSQRFMTTLPNSRSAFALYQNLRHINPAPFAAYLNFSDVVLASASPERFVKLSAGQVETRPIKGTCPRGRSSQEDERLAQALLASEKDRAENIMIVDLLRNDLSRVCEDFSVQVPQICGLESYATVHHLVSVVTGRLQEKLTAVDLLMATFPGGSVTGAPKCRAMEIIAELEPTRRGPYCGSIAYLGFDGNMDSSITIRTFCIRDKRVSFQAGGAVVADSSPRQEYEEVLVKAGALLKALGGDYDLAD